MGRPSSKRRRNQMGRRKEQASPETPQVHEAGRSLFLLPLRRHRSPCGGVVTVVKEWYAEGSDVNSEAVVDVKAPRLSVLSVPEKVWERVCELGNGFEGDGFEIGEEDAEV
ncbi:hypothetical protein F3Y22_tig00011761pilonHSYRG00003 [Hibiscus syriacus]|uniref:Uncharacterized protein n=1 Tax=Hibiscus syriacus TaxID=106335 RepID=A0A6A3C799_HIBSY|nr:hypothetical protein F3Y22_tig00011761pilonHSYRG00003 [Hibiscus syriacus]